MFLKITITRKRTIFLNSLKRKAYLKAAAVIIKAVVKVDNMAAFFCGVFKGVFGPAALAVKPGHNIIAVIYHKGIAAGVTTGEILLGNLYNLVRAV